MMGARNAQGLAAWRRKAGAHSERRRPDVFDNINRYEEEELEELKNRLRGMESMNPKNREIAKSFERPNEQDFGVGDRVRVRVTGPYCWCEGLVVKRDENLDGDPVWTVDMEGAGMACFLTHELDRRTS